MFSGIQRLVAALAAGLPTVIAIALLGGLGAWGMANHWKVPSFSSLREEKVGEEKDETEGAARVVAEEDKPSSQEPGAKGARIEFPDAEAVQKAGIQGAPAEVRPLALHVTAPGMIDYDPSLYVQLTARVPGTVWRVFKDIGDPVRKGDVLALVESAEVGRTKADFAQSVVQFNLKNRTYESLYALSLKGATPDQTLRSAETALREARIRLFNDQQALLNLGFSLRLDEVMPLSEEQLARHLRLLGVPESVRKELDADAATANLLPVVAPFQGKVVRRSAAPGEVLNSAQPKALFVVADVTRLHIDLDVLPRDVVDLRIGQKVIFAPESRPEDLATGRLTHFSPEVDEKTRRVRVHAEFANTEERFRPNSFGTGRVLLQERADAVVVPRDALQTDGDTHFVFVRLSEKVFQVRKVRPGLRDENFVEVLGVRPGEEIVTAGSYLLKSELLKDRIASGD